MSVSKWKEKIATIKWKRLLAWGGLICLISLSGYGVYVYLSLKETANKMYLPVRTQKSVEIPVATEPASVRQTSTMNSAEGATPPAAEVENSAILAKEPITLLLLGVDERENDKGRSDVILVLSVNPKTKSALLISIPRDTRTVIAHKSTQDKINHAYAFGGVQQAVDTVEQFLQLPVDYVVTANMEGFAGVIDALGGVEVNNKLAFTYADYTFPVGPIQLDGKQALVYARMRYEDPKGDLGRNERQQEIIKALLDKGVTLASPTRLNDVLTTMGKYVKTNMTFDVMKQLALSYSTAVTSVETIRLEGKGQMINGIYYYIVSPQERERLTESLSTFQKQIEPPVQLPKEGSDSIAGQRGKQDE
ncbi:LCP family glycopolymer transferase [Brevibacillus brevis]|uniref:LCP family glycopolymer transferase n=1 Tax=Brevibacillus brevis TaxID=1393 RepID=UPI0025A59BEA|nr:LCP family protein [Brevibacillus brevis]WJQ80069.1 LCP family protein [Brevibacillus brevis]